MGKNTCGVPVEVNTALGKSSHDRRPTIAIERTSMTISIVFLSYGLTLHDHMARAFRIGELIVATASIALAFVQLPLLETTYGQVLPEQHVKGGIDLLERVIANENNCIKAFQNHTDFWSRIPAVVAICGKVRPLKSVSTASAHGFQKCCTVFAVKSMLGGIVVE